MPVVQTAQLNGHVFCDDNGNGHLDPGEHVFSDVMIRLTGGNLTTPQFTTTDVNGVYSFTNLAPGTYQIHLVDVPPSFRVGGVVMLPLNVFRATPGTIDGVPVGTGTISFINDVALPGNSSSINNDFPLLCVTQRAPVSISGHAYYDSNRDCNFETVDRSLAGVIVHAIAVDDTGHVVLDQQSTTDNDGRYAFVFSPLTLGRIFKFRITFTTPSGYTFEAAKAGDFGGNVNHNEIDDVDLTDGNDAVGYDACYVRDVPPTPPPSKSDFLANGNSSGSGSGVGGTVDFGQVITNPSFNNINPGQRTGVRYLVTGADLGGGPHVRVFDYLTGREVFSFFAYSPVFIGGVRVATGDVNGDGISDIITAPGFGGGPVVRVWDGATGALIDEFNAYGPSFRGGVYVAVGDINGDGRDEIITGAGEGGGPHVKVFSVTGIGANISVSQTAEFMAYDSSFRGGVRVAAADFNNDGFDDIVTGAGIGGGPHVKVFNMQQPTNGTFALITQFMAFDASFRGGVFVAAGNQDRGDVTGDGRPDLVVGMGAGGNTVKVFSGTDFSLFTQFEGFAANTSGVRVGLLDVNGDGRSEVLVGSGPQYGAFVRAVNLTGTQRDLDFFAPYGRFLGGVFVAGS